MDHLWASAFSTCGLMCGRRCYTEGRRRVRTHGLRTELVAVVVCVRTGGWGGIHGGGGWKEVWWVGMGSCQLAWTSGPPHTLLVVVVGVNGRQRVRTHTWVPYTLVLVGGGWCTRSWVRPCRGWVVMDGKG